ncbi:MAG: Do family serine endopeptidase [Geminicoccaceae bacterium]
MTKHIARLPNRRARLALIGGTSALALAAFLAAPLSAQNSTAVPASTTNEPAAYADSYADLVDRIMPAVVAVQSERSVETVQMFGMPEGRGDGDRPGRGNPRGFDGPHGRGGPDRFDGPDGRGGPRAQGMGSGFVIAEDGQIVTNHHVIAGAESITVRFQDGRELNAELVGSDPKTDLALLRVDADAPLPTVTWSEDDDARVGDKVLAVGHPFGLGSTVTAGIISALGRDIGSGPYDDFLQIDAPINRGNSGGPTFDLEGRVVGVNTAIFSPSGGNVGIGFAVPADLARSIIADLSDDGLVERGWLGVAIQPVDEDLERALGLQSDDGALVTQVQPDTPAEQAGLQRGDLIVGYNGQTIASVRDLTRAVADTDPGSTVDTEVIRDGERQTISVTIASLQPEEQAMASSEQAEQDDTPKLGIALAELDEETRSRFDLGNEVQGALIANVNPQGRAAAKGVRPGDVIVEIDGRSVTNPQDVVDAMRSLGEREADTALLLLQRNDSQRFVAVPLDDA